MAAVIGAGGRVLVGGGRCSVVRNVHVHEEQVAVGGESPVLRRHHSLSRVASLADINHGLEAKHACEGALEQCVTVCRVYVRT